MHSAYPWYRALTEVACANVCFTGLHAPSLVEPRRINTPWLTGRSTRRLHAKTAPTQLKVRGLNNQRNVEGAYDGAAGCMPFALITADASGVRMKLINILDAPVSLALAIIAAEKARVS